MFENVFGYDQKFMPDKQQMEEEKHAGNLPMQSISTPYVVAGYEQNPLIVGGYTQDSGDNMPEVVLDQIPETMRASEN